MPSKTYRGGFTVVLALALMLVTNVAAGCQRDVPTVSRPLDLSTVAPCATEDGSYGQESGAWPCVWDAQTQGDGRWGPAATRWTLYVDTGCPVATVQPSEHVTCIDVREWLQGPAGESTR